MKRTALYITAGVIIAIMVLLVLISRGTFGGSIKQLSGFSNEFTLTAYTVEWCGHCKNFKPELAKLGSSQTVNGKTVAIVNVDPEKQPDKKSATIKGYPTVILSTPSGDQEYQGERTKEAIVAFLQSVVS